MVAADVVISTKGKGIAARLSRVFLPRNEAMNSLDLTLPLMRVLRTIVVEMLSTRQRIIH
jgi:hypothetical protein